VLLADMGNTHVHLFDGIKVVHLGYKEAIETYGQEKLYYISVNTKYQELLQQCEAWFDVAPYITLPNSYKGMGVDRQALCKSVTNGILIDAGSAITIDIMSEGAYEGGVILPGIHAYLKAYETISPLLQTNLNKEVNLAALPRSTRDAISYGIIASIKILIATHQSAYKSHPLYFTGGDGAFLASFFKKASFDERLVFKGLQRALKEHHLC
jgi:type III pantothenate kinase